MFCPGCGANNEDGARFCYRCGRRLADGTEKVPAVYGSLEVGNCKDSKGNDCKLLWSITSIDSRPDGLAIGYDIRVAGQTGCSVALAADSKVVTEQMTAGKPGSYVEGGDGR